MAHPLQHRRESPLPGLAMLGAGVGTAAAFFAGIAKKEWEEQSIRINKVVIGMILGAASGGTGGAFVGAIRHAFCRRRERLFDSFFSAATISQTATIFLSFTAGVGLVQLIK